jgi:hypothetical protein
MTEQGRESNQTSIACEKRHRYLVPIFYFPDFTADSMSQTLSRPFQTDILSKPEVEPPFYVRVHYHYYRRYDFVCHLLGSLFLYKVP